MSRIHSRFGLDCWLRSCPTVPCIGQDKTFKSGSFCRMESFTKQKCLWRSILALIWSSQHSHLNLISWQKKVWVKVRPRLRRGFCRLKWEVFDKWSLDFPICRPSRFFLSLFPLFIQTFRRPICTHWSLNMLLTRGRKEGDSGTLTCRKLNLSSYYHSWTLTRCHWCHAGC